MNQQELLDGLASLQEADRQAFIHQHWQLFLGEEFIGFVEGQISSGQQLLQDRDLRDNIFGGLSPDAREIIEQQLAKTLNGYIDVWNSMAAVAQHLVNTAEEEGSGSTRGSRVQPNSSATGARCSQCGAPAVASGLCSNCLAVQQDQEQQDLEYDRQLYDQQQDLLDYQRRQDDQSYYDQMDYNTYNDYNDW
ncbi:MAG: hypothetical protein D6775_06195 [Caldilineae bacterium]|nr:MAG: hypothetical protein D6775_06195 [Caldilineae bacterium]